MIRGDKKESCPYCGEDEHKVPLCCPRISYIVVYSDNSEVEIHFWPDDDPAPTVAA